MPQLYLDLDGVLADFDAGAERILGMHPGDYQDLYGPGRFWKSLSGAPEFYARLPLMADAMDLYTAVSHLRPIILTGLPIGKWAEPQKRAWVQEHFPGVEVITTLARHKSRYCKPGDVLVDDRVKYSDLWEAAGGVFIHHRDANSSIAELRSRGLL